MTRVKTREGNRRIRGLFRSFDASIAGRPAGQAVVVALALRGINYYMETWRLSDRSPNAATALLRALLDLTILVKWIEGNPRLRVRMWLADDDLTQLRIADEYDRVRAGRGFASHGAFTSAQRGHMLRHAERIRAIAVTRKERVNSTAGNPLLPDARTRAQLAGDAAEVYFLFGLFSGQAHVAAAVLSRDRFEPRPSGLHIRVGRPIDAEAIRAIAVSAVCMLLASASRQLSLGVEAKVDAIRVALAAWPQPAASLPTP